MDAAYHQLISAGASPHTEIRNVMNIRIAQVTDPFGNILGLTGPAIAAHKRTVESQPSETAIHVAFCRALAACDPRDDPRSGPFGDALLTEEMKRALGNPAARAMVIRTITSPLYGYLIARTAFIDQVFKKELRGGIAQIVFLGAGYDTRAYRFHQDLGTRRLFELDIATTQNRKKELLEKANIPTPPQLALVPIDFKTENLAEVLVKAGFSPNPRTLFLWEGVMYYLPAPTVKPPWNS